jgi:hypothetical protein
VSRLVALAILVAAAAVLARFGVRFHQKQNSGALGGKISRAKAYWLPFAIFFWFVVCPLVGFSSDIATPLRIALASFGVFMWLRGAVEMVMLYVTKNWRPPLGISHDVLCILLLVAVLVRFHADLAGFAGLDAWALFLVGVAVVSLIVEIHHAYSFFVAVKGMTTGDDGVWFADDVDERFRAINRNTLVWNVILTTCVAAFLARYLAHPLLLGSAP